MLNALVFDTRVLLYCTSNQTTNKTRTQKFSLIFKSLNKTKDFGIPQQHNTVVTFQKQNQHIIHLDYQIYPLPRLFTSQPFTFIQYMSFLLLKSKSRSNRSTSSAYRRSSNADRNPSVAPSKTSNSSAHSSRRFVNAGGGQVQLQRTHQKQQKQHSRQQQQQQQVVQTTNDVISMDEGTQT